MPDDPLGEETRRLGQFLEFGALDVVVGLDEAEMDDEASIALPSIAGGR